MITEVNSDVKMMCCEKELKPSWTSWDKGKLYAIGYKCPVCNCVKRHMISEPQ